MSKEKTAHREVFEAVVRWMDHWNIRVSHGQAAAMELEATLKKLVPTGYPELLEACRECASLLRLDTDPSDLQTVALQHTEAAIAKAEGKT